jgi:hypothetical protein
MNGTFYRMLALGAATIAASIAVLTAFLLLYRGNTFYYFAPPIETHLFAIQSVDTMKYSRDVAGQILDDPDSFQSIVDTQMGLIAEMGATHAAIATPYDARFLPVLKLWVASARAHGLSVWFRGNFSGWEGWFDYEKIDRATHKQLLKDFIRNNPNLFENGDVFTPCPECENGGPGDPRQTGDADGYNAFLREEKTIADSAFAAQDTRIAVYPSMNADIARQTITPKTVSAFGGTILIDHYVRTPEQFARDIQAIPKQLRASVGLGEFGAPIPDLNGDMTQAQQAHYIDSLFHALYLERTSIPVVNYWVLNGGSTALINDDGTPRAAYTTIRNYFKAFNVYGVIHNSLGEKVSGARVRVNDSDYSIVAKEDYQIFVPRQYKEVTIQADGYVPVTLKMPSDTTTTLVKRDVYLEPIQPGWWYKLRTYLYTKLQLKSHID